MENAIEIRNNASVSFFGNIAAFEDAQRMAKMLMTSKIIPESFRNNVADCVIALEMANRMGVNPIAVMQNLYIVHGKPSWSAQFIVAAINQSSRFKTTIMYEVSGEGDEKGCIAYALDFSGNRIDSPRVTIGMAKKEGWYTKNGSKWQTMEDLMLRYRAATLFGRLYTPDLLMGMQTKEEMEDVADAKGAEQPKQDLNTLAKTIEAPALDTIEEAKEDNPPIDPFIKIKIELRKLGVKPDEAAAFIKAQGIQTGEVEAWLSDMGALKTTYEEYKKSKERAQ
jgi:hypothetical protein